jgi:hypothetical protein
MAKMPNDEYYALRTVASDKSDKGDRIVQGILALAAMAGFR